jgi:hypothetical protein
MYILVCGSVTLQKGDAMPKPKYNDKSMVVRLPSELATLARRKAKQERRPLSVVIRELIRGWLAEQSQPVQAIK